MQFIFFKISQPPLTLTRLLGNWKKYVTPYGNNGYRDVKAISIHKAIEIVKQGGVGEDVSK